VITWVADPVADVSGRPAAAAALAGAEVTAELDGTVWTGVDITGDGLAGATALVDVVEAVELDDEDAEEDEEDEEDEVIGDVAR
jgi:hypothetical protein